MDKLKIIVLFLFVNSFFAAHAQMKEEVIEYNIGVISPDKVIKKSSKFNEEITNAVSMCDCLEVNVKREKDSSVVELEFNPAEYKGLAIAEAKLIGKNSRVITLRLRAYVSSPSKAKKEQPGNKSSGSGKY